jgi:tetratricopeptide (TPR) repeat protein
MKKILSLLIFFMLANHCFGQNYKEAFDKLSAEGDTSGQIVLLTKWESVEPDNPELLTSYFNYYFQKSRQEVVTILSEEPHGESLILKDRHGQVAGFISSKIVYNPEVLQKGFDKIDRGIELYPNRLDMRFGKIYALGQAEDWEAFTKEIVKTIQYSKQNKNEWSWTHDEKKEDAEVFFLESIQGYQLSLFETENDDLLENMRTVAEEVLKVYPEHTESMSNIAITYLLTNEYDKGIKVLLEAEKIDPEDGIILSNIAHGYNLKGDTVNSIKYYEKMLKLDDPRAVEFAKEQIKMLKR